MMLLGWIEGKRYKELLIIIIVRDNQRGYQREYQKKECIVEVEVSCGRSKGIDFPFLHHFCQKKKPPEYDDFADYDDICEYLRS